ncbi:hypothetical protein GCM10009127_27270 [Alteraurantiacibacter aestuarii]
MYQVDKSNRMIGLAVTTAMAGVLLSGCATNPAPRADISAAAAQEAMAEGRSDRAIRLAEEAVQADPRNAAYRTMLGTAYLDAGRFASAQTSFNDAMSLGDNSPRTALSLSLALTAQAKYEEAAALLNDWEGEIGTSDLGLALALAGQPQRGIHLLSNAIRGGENTVKMRQNLAYAYAMAGRWREARLMAAQDVPADQLGDRMAYWAEMASPLAHEHRIAGLLGVPADVRDQGQPVQLALANTPGVEQLIAEASAYAAAEPAAVQVAPSDTQELAALETIAIPASGRELPPGGEPDIALTRYQAPTTERPTSVEQAFATRAPEGGSLAQVAQDVVRFVSEPVVQTTPVRYGATPEPRVAGQAGQPSRPIARRAIPSAAQQSVIGSDPVEQGGEELAATPVSLSADGSHLVQLGSFASEQGARRAWGIYVSRYPELAGHEMVLTEAIIRGKRYFRVSAGGFDRVASRTMCSRVEASNGDGCITWAAASPLPGAVDTGIRFASR